MHSLKSLVLLAFPVAIAASPVLEARNGNWECAAINWVVNDLKAYPSATPFCSSWLKIPTITSIVTQTSTAVVPKLLTTVISTFTPTSTITATA